MVSEAQPRSVEIPVGARPGKWKTRARDVLKRPLLVIAIVLILILMFVTVVGPSLTPYGSEELAAGRFESPSGTHWFGTDELGRDILSRVVVGARLSLTIGLVGSIVGASLGGLIGSVTGYWGGKVDLLVQRMIDALQAFPIIILALAIVAVLGSSPRTIMIAAVIAFIPGSTRVIRSAVLETKERDFVTAAVVIGATDLRILFRHVLPQAMAPFFRAGLAVCRRGDPAGVWTQLPWGRSSASRRLVGEDDRRRQPDLHRVRTVGAASPRLRPHDGRLRLQPPRGQLARHARSPTSRDLSACTERAIAAVSTAPARARHSPCALRPCALRPAVVRGSIRPAEAVATHDSST